MALGTHWEWRGFGAVSSTFAYRFCELEPAYPDFGDKPQALQDAYLWVPGLEVNVKLRPDLSTEPFKFKSLLDKDGDLEKWAERPEDICEFPLTEDGWDMLARRFAAAHVDVGPFPTGGADATTTLARLAAVGVHKVMVDKERFSTLWRKKVAVQWTSIRTPQAITSIGLETWLEEEGQPAPSDETAKADLLAAVEDLGLVQEPLQAMNYLDALAVWAVGERI